MFRIKTSNIKYRGTIRIVRNRRCILKGVTKIMHDKQKVAEILSEYRQEIYPQDSLRIYTQINKL